MRLLTFASQGAARPGALLSTGDVLDLRRALTQEGAGACVSIASLLAGGPTRLAEVAAAVDAAEADLDLAREQGRVVAAGTVALLGPTGHNPALYTIGPLYADHLAEMGVSDVRPVPIGSALRTANAIIGSGSAITLPRAAPDMVDWEGEFALVIGRPAYRLDPATALDHVVGYTLYNDVGGREHAQAYVDEINRPEGPSGRVAGLNLQYKEFPTFSPLGPCIATTDELDLDTAVLRTTVNGEVVQEFAPADTLVPVAEALAMATRTIALRPGDVVSLGTAAGVGFARTPPRYLRPGDVVSVSVDGIGSLTNPVVADDPEEEGTP